MKNFALTLAFSCSIFIVSGIGINFVESAPPKTKIVAVEDNIPYWGLHKISFLVITPEGTGSGTLITRKVDGKEHRFILTCAHVVQNMIQEDGTFKDEELKVSQTDDVLGRVKAGVTLRAKVVAYSPLTDGKDIAILRILDKEGPRHSAVFELREQCPKVGTKIIHIGSVFGPTFDNSFFFGRISRVGRQMLMPDGKTNKILEQVSVLGNKGCSGGGVFTEDGTYIGMFEATASEGVNLVIPIREITAWAKENDLYWVFDAKAKVPESATAVLE